MKLYDILGVAKDASQAAIKAAYRKLAKKLHPDKKGGSVDEFKELQTAYDVLKDEKKRNHYDKTGDTKSREKTPQDMLLDIFIAVIGAEDFEGNIIDRVKEKIYRQLNSHKSRASEIEGKITSIEKLKGRISSDQENMFEMALSGTALQLTGALEATKKEIDEMISVSECLDEYEDTAPIVENSELADVLESIAQAERKNNRDKFKSPFEFGDRF